MLQQRLIDRAASSAAIGVRCRRCANGSSFSPWSSGSIFRAGDHPSAPTPARCIAGRSPHRSPPGSGRCRTHAVDRSPGAIAARRQGSSDGDRPHRSVCPPPKPDPSLIKAFVKAHRFDERLLHGGASKFADLAKSENLHRSYYSQVLRLPTSPPTSPPPFSKGNSLPVSPRRC